MKNRVVHEVVVIIIAAGKSEETSGARPVAKPA